MDKKPSKTDKKEGQKEDLNIEIDQPKYKRIEPEEIEIRDVIVKTDKECEVITQIRFQTNLDTEITWKPTETKEEKSKLKGLQLVSEYREPVKLDDTPKKLFEINNKVNEKGSCLVSTGFTLMNTKDNEGNPVHYRFLSNKDFEELEIL